MFSLDPAIERGYGYPLLYQSGELYKGQPIHDRQHPHDLISELAVSYSYKFNDKRSFYLYAGLPAEPALGPPMYLHRVSGMNNPDAPIGHHWQDATHITYGVVTAGYSFGKVKFEASAFNGTEPDENRWNFDRPRLNSFSGRLSVNPTKNWSLQISQGYLRNPERSEPEVRILRKTIASAIYNKKFDDEHNWETSLVWGVIMRIVRALTLSLPRVITTSTLTLSSDASRQFRRVVTILCCRRHSTNTTCSTSASSPLATFVMWSVTKVLISGSAA